MLEGVSLGRQACPPPIPASPVLPCVLKEPELQGPSWPLLGWATCQERLQGWGVPAGSACTTCSGQPAAALMRGWPAEELGLLRPCQGRRWPAQLS